MTGRRRLGLVAASATLLASAPLSAIFQSWTWLLQCALTVGLIAGAVTLARTLRFPGWAQACTMLVTLLFTLSWLYRSGTGLPVPGPATFGHFGDLLSEAGNDTRSYGVPVPDRAGLLFIAVLGIGAVAIAVDLLTVVVRRPALAGLPMLAIYSVPVAVYVDSVPVLPFIVGSIGFLWLLVADNVDRVRRFGRRFTGDGRDVDVWEPSPLAAAGRRLGLVGVVVAVLLPLLVPTFSSSLLSQLTQGGSASNTGATNGTGKVNLFASLSGQLAEGATVTLLKVKTNETDPFYLRFGVADQLTTTGFGSRPTTGNAITNGQPDPLRDTPGDDTFHKFHAQVEITDAFRQGLLPVYTGTSQINDLGDGWSYDPAQQVVFSTGRSSTKGKKYNFDYERANYTPTELRTAPTTPPDDALRRLYTSTPKDATVDNKVAELIKGKTTDYEKVRALYSYFSRENGFTYSLTTGSTGNSSEIASFLKNKVGYCQQYAAALAWMVRAANIPARVAFGFTRGQINGDTYQITNHNAHAWTEVYLQNFGWIPFDATPAAGVPGSVRSNYAPDNDRPAPTVSTPAQAAPGAEPNVKTSRATRDPGAAADSGPAGGGTTTQSSGPSVTNVLTAVGIALLLALLAVPALLRVLLRRRRLATASPRVLTVDGSPPPPPDSTAAVVVTADAARARADAHAAWDEVIDTMIDFRVPIDPSETPRVTAQRLVRDTFLPEDPAGAATLLGQAEERARYARVPLADGELNAALTQVRKGIAHSATRRTRLAAVLLPPSILRQWRRSLSSASTRTASAASRIRNRLVRFSPRRLLPQRSR